MSTELFKIGDIVQHREWKTVTARVLSIRHQGTDDWQPGYWVERLTGRRAGYDHAGFAGDLFGQSELKAATPEDAGMLW